MTTRFGGVKGGNLLHPPTQRQWAPLASRQGMSLLANFLVRKISWHRAACYKA